MLERNAESKLVRWALENLAVPDQSSHAAHPQPLARLCSEYLACVACSATAEPNSPVGEEIFVRDQKQVQGVLPRDPSFPLPRRRSGVSRWRLQFDTRDSASFLISPFQVSASLALPTLAALAAFCFCTRSAWVLK